MRMLERTGTLVVAAGISGAGMGLAQSNFVFIALPFRICDCAMSNQRQQQEQWTLDSDLDGFDIDTEDLYHSLPLKKVPAGDIFEASRAGDVNRLRYLIESGANVNLRDRWDSVALYYACLAGHLDAARMLLENGAICDEHTFDGDRCHYASLNLRVRKLLKAFEARPPPLDPLHAALRETFLGCAANRAYLVQSIGRVQGRTCTRQRAPAAHIMEHLWCSITHTKRWQPWLPPPELHPVVGEAAALPPEPAGEAAADRPSRPDDDQLHLVAGEQPTSPAVGPTIAEPSSPPSKPFITTATASTSQICRQRKPTLITEATRGESSSPVINKFNSIPLRSPFIMQATVHPLPATVAARARTAASTRTLPRSDATTSAPPANRLHRPQSRRSLAPAFANPDPVQFTVPAASCRLQHVVNVGSIVDDRRFALKAAAKATILAATVPNDVCGLEGRGDGCAPKSNPLLNDGSVSDNFPPDVVFYVQGRPIEAHRVLLSARSPFFRRRFEEKWKDRKEVRFAREKLSCPALFSLIHFFYSDRLEVAVDDMEDLLEICKVCKCEELWKVLAKELIHQKYADYKSLGDVDSSQKRFILQGLSLPESDRLPAAMHRILQSSLVKCSGVVDEVLMRKPGNDLADVCIRVDQKILRCHQVILASRSEYFKVRLSRMTDFLEGRDRLPGQSLPILEEHDLSAEAFEKIIEYMYTDGLKDVDPNQAEEIFDAASRYLLFPLKRAVADALLPHLEMASPAELCHWYGVLKVREYCLDAIAWNFETIADTRGFRAMLSTLPPPSGDSTLRTTLPSAPGAGVNAHQGNLLDDLREKWLEAEAAELDKRDESAALFDKRLEMLMLVAEQENMHAECQN
ncbi:hypothetical protein ACLOJK_000705 [Asimina triloba]